ncbi:AI-2E family transporter [Acetobacter sp. AN02]|uniref:AI-2E family transporter n=1 Tax=Acetobacter sp. AN02 TaxID=2894186 RepID=UPI002434112F|nr:AI-2E family transporter [Acetobacter sp. AN02]MDG6093637.1 AI-2E family transporter [Acetobacter sp. AN02]
MSEKTGDSPVQPPVPPLPGRSQSLARGILALVCVTAAVFTIRDFLPALAWGTVFAVATAPVYEKAKARWPGASGGLLLPVAATALLTMIFLVPMIMIAMEAAREAHSVLALTQTAREQGLPMPEIVQRLPFGRATIMTWWQNNLADPRRVHEVLTSLTDRGLAMTRTLGSELVHRGMLFCFSLLTLFFLLKDGDTVRYQCLIASRRVFGKRGEAVARQIAASIRGTVAGLVLVGFGDGLLMGVVYFAMDIPHPALLGVITAVAAMLPFFGYLAVGVAALMAASSGAVAHGITVFAIGVVVIFIAEHFIRPPLIGGSTQLPFLWVLFGILGGVETWGLLGLFVGPAAMATVHLLWKNWTRERPAEDPAPLPPKTCA